MSRLSKFSKPSGLNANQSTSIATKRKAKKARKLARANRKRNNT